ncbi:hypothetical protein BDP55DRAFT_672762, partial [Colletotrichum godetiae]
MLTEGLRYLQDQTPLLLWLSSLSSSLMCRLVRPPSFWRSIGQKKDDDGKKFKSCTTGEQPRDWATNRRMICQAPSSLQMCMSQFGANAQDGLDEPCVAWLDDSSPNDGFSPIAVWRYPPRTISDFGHHPALHWLPPCRSRGIGREHLAHWRNPSSQQILSSTQGYILQQVQIRYRLSTGATDYGRGWAMLDGSGIQGKSLACLGSLSSCDGCLFSTSENTPPWLRAQRSPPRGGTETQRAGFILTNAVDLFTQVTCTSV